MWWTNVETIPYGGYPQLGDVKTLRLIEDANPGGQSWSGEPSNDAMRPYGTYEGQTLFEAAQTTLKPESARVLGYLPTDEEWNSPNIYEDNPAGKLGTRNQLDASGVQLPVHKTSFFYLARICNHCSYRAGLLAWPRQAVCKLSEDAILVIHRK